MPIVTSPALSVTPRGEREIVATRRFGAPRRFVWAAWTTPGLFVRWFGPKGWTVPECEMDVRPGGTFRYVMRNADGRDILMRGTYREVVPPERLVSTEAFEGFTEVGWRPEDATVNTVVLTEKDARTTLTLTVLYPSQQVRDAAAEDPNAWVGFGETLDRLAELLAQRS